MDYQYKYCETFEEVKTLVKYCKQTGFCCHDFETSGGHYIEPTSFPTIISVSFQPGSAWVVPLGHKDSPLKSMYKKVMRYIGRELIENPDIIKIAHNLKFEYKWWKKYGIIMQGRLYDTMLQKYILKEERPNGLKDLVAMFLPEFAGYDLKGQPTDKAGIDKVTEFWSNVPIDELSLYGSLDADLTFRLWVFFENRLFENDFHPIYRNLLMMATRVLGDAEYTGMYTDRKYLEELLITYKDKIDICESKLRNLPEVIEYEEKRLKEVKKDFISNLKKEIKELEENDGSPRVISNRKNKLNQFLMGAYTTKKEREMMAPINFNSTQQLIGLFFENSYGLNWDVIQYTINKDTKRETDRPSLSEEVLNKLNIYHSHPILDLLLELRKLSKMNSTYVVGMYDKLRSDDRIHGNFLIHGTTTGRLSSRAPNLQNIPRDTTAKDIKKMFIAPPGKLILHLDYSQAELRVMAYLAKEETMMEWFRIGRDIHLSTACKKYKADYDEVKPIVDDEEHPEHTLWKIRRKQAKTTNFGIAYEQGPGKLAEKLTDQGVPTTKEEARDILNNWFKDFPNVKKFINSQHRRAKKYGYVKNLFGRKRRLVELLNSPNEWKQAEALRLSVNSPIQGSASDFALFSSVLIWESVKEGKLPPDLEQFGTVHDSLLFYINPEDIHSSVPILARICANPETKEWFHFEVKGVEMKVDFDIGKSWGELKSYKQEEDYTKWV